MPGMPAVTRRARAIGPGQHYGPAGTGGSAEARTAIRSCPARRAVVLPRCSWWPGNLVELRVVAAQNLKRKRWATSWRDAWDEIGAGWGLRVGLRWCGWMAAGWKVHAGAWRAVRRHRFALGRSRPLK